MKLQKVGNGVSRLRQLVAVHAIALVAVAGGLVQTAQAAGTDFSTVTAGLDVSTIVAGVIAAAVLLAGAGFAVWGAKKIGKFFG